MISLALILMRPLLDMNPWRKMSPIREKPIHISNHANEHVKPKIVVHLYQDLRCPSTSNQTYDFC